MHSQLHLHHGFRSVYCWRWQERQELEQRGHLRRIQDIPVVSTELLVDFDDKPTEADQFSVWLQDNGIMFNKYQSGNRSTHYHVLTTWQEGVWVPYAQREWARRYAVGADLTIYHHAGLFRLPGTFHEKSPGGRKTLLYAASGRPLEIPRQEPRLRSIPLTPLGSDEAAEKLQRGLGRTVTEGGRRVHAWYLGAMAYDAGLTFEQACDKILEWNISRSVPALDQGTVIDKITEAFNSRGME